MRKVLVGLCKLHESKATTRRANVASGFQIPGKRDERKFVNEAQIGREKQFL